MEFRMADFKCQTIYLCDDFSPEGYKQRYKLHTPRLFLLSKTTQYHQMTLMMIRSCTNLRLSLLAEEMR